MKLEAVSKIIVLIIAGALGVSGCQFAPKKYEQEKEGYWQAKVLVKDKSASRSFIVNVDFNAVANEKLRMDVTAAMGEHVASFLQSQQDIRYVIMREKKYFKSRATAGALKPILATPLDPRIVENILFERWPTNKEWTCTRDKKNFLAECKQTSTDLVIKWGERKGERRTVFIQHPTADLQFNFYSFKPKVEPRKNLFLLSPPKGFEVIEL